jgi:type IV pilus assembly protein PilE
MHINKKAFTLIELLVVVLIIGILAAIALPQYTLAVEKSRLMKLFPMMKSIAQAKELYRLATGQYTGDIDLLDISVPYITKTLHGTYYYYTFENISGKLGVRNDNNAITIIYVNEASNYLIDYYYNSHMILCYAAPDSKGEKICKSIGVFSQAAGGNNYYTIK